MEVGKDAAQSHIGARLAPCNSDHVTASMIWTKIHACEES